MVSIGIGQVELGLSDFRLFVLCGSSSVSPSPCGFLVLDRFFFCVQSVQWTCFWSFLVGLTGHGLLKPVATTHFCFNGTYFV